MGYRIAVAGATGNVGREVLSILAERRFPADEVIALASSHSIGVEVGYGEDQTLKVRELAAFDFDGIDIVLSSPGAKVSAEHSPRAAKAGAVVIDNTSHFRMHPDVPLVVPEVNPDAVAGYRKRGIIANPNCSTIQLVTALKPLHDLSPIKRVVVATYQSTSGGGKAPMDELFNQTRGIFTNQPVQKFQENFTKQIAFNVIPHIDVFMDDGSTKEEWKIVAETRKILDPDIALTATCVRVPVFIGHAEAVNVEFDGPVSEDAARKGKDHGLRQIEIFVRGPGPGREAAMEKKRAASLCFCSLSISSVGVPCLVSDLIFWSRPERLASQTSISIFRAFTCGYRALRCSSS